MRTIIFFLLGISFIVSGCQKIKDEQAALLTYHAWRKVKDIVQNVDTMYLAPVCQLDDALSFTTDGRYTLTEGSFDCSPNSPDVLDSGTWSIGTFSTITIDPDATNSTVYNLAKLTSDSLILTPVFLGGGRKIVYTSY